MELKFNSGILALLLTNAASTALAKEQGDKKRYSTSIVQDRQLHNNDKQEVAHLAKDENAHDQQHRKMQIVEPVIPGQAATESENNEAVFDTGRLNPSKQVRRRNNQRKNLRGVQADKTSPTTVNEDRVLKKRKKIDCRRLRRGDGDMPDDCDANTIGEGGNLPPTESDEGRGGPGGKRGQDDEDDSADEGKKGDGGKKGDKEDSDDSDEDPASAEDTPDVVEPATEAAEPVTTVVVVVVTDAPTTEAPDVSEPEVEDEVDEPEENEEIDIEDDVRIEEPDDTDVIVITEPIVLPTVPAVPVTTSPTPAPTKAPTRAPTRAPTTATPTESPTRSSCYRGTYDIVAAWCQEEGNNCCDLGSESCWWEGEATICEGSCNGKFACYSVQENTLVEEGSCNGYVACAYTGADIDIGLASCNGRYSCTYSNGNIGDGSCNGGYPAGSNCYQVDFDVGDNSCNYYENPAGYKSGSYACIYSDEPIGSNQCNAFYSDSTCIGLPRP